MKAIQFQTLPVPSILQNDVECFTVAHYPGSEALTIKQCPNGLPGIVFQHHQGRSAIGSVLTPSGLHTCTPTLFLYGQATQPSIINQNQGPSTMTQVIFKPHALHTLLGINASAVTNLVVDLHEFSAGDLPVQLIEAKHDQERLMLLTRFLVAKLQQAKTRDEVIEESLRAIHQHVGTITIKYLLEHVHLSERQFERRFTQAVGISPQLYLRVKRFNEAARLLKTRHFDTLTRVASALNFYDQSHFIHDIKTFSGTTPKSLAQKTDAFHGASGYSYL